MVSHWLTAYSEGSARLELGTQDIEGAIEWGMAVDYLGQIFYNTVCDVINTVKAIREIIAEKSVNIFHQIRRNLMAS